PEQTVAHAAAAQEHAPGRRTLRQKTLYRIGDDTRYEVAGCAQQIVQRTGRLLGELNGLVDDLLREALPGHTLGRPALQIRVRQPALQQHIQATALDAVLAARIEFLAPAGQALHEAVEEEIARPRFETENVLQPAAGGQVD